MRSNLIKLGILCSNCLVLIDDLRKEKHTNHSNRYCEGREIYVIFNHPGHERLCSSCSDIDCEEIKALSELIASEF